MRNMHKSFFFSILIFCCVTLSAHVYKNNVVVSYYADDFHGKKTSNGEIFNMYDLTCANKSLPFNTVLRVTNLANGKKVDVRVNDRGPFVASRELDLSKAAAVKLDMIKSGTAKVKIEIISLGKYDAISDKTAAKACKIAGIPYTKVKLGTGSSSQSASTKVSASPSASNGTSASSSSKTYDAGTVWDIQLGAFGKKENANALAQKLLKAGFSEVAFQKTDSVYRVVIRKVPGENVNQMLDELSEKGFTEHSVRPRKAPSNQE